MLPTDTAPQVFSTAGLPDARRVELWEQYNATALIGLNVHSAEPLKATEVNVQLSHVRLARVRGSAHAVERGPEIIQRDPAFAIAIYLGLRGDSWFRQPQGSHSLRPGQVIVCDADQPFARGFARGLDELVVTVGRTALASRGGPDGLRVPVVTTSGRRDPYARALARVADRATRTSSQATSVASACGDASGTGAGPAGAGPGQPPDESTVLDLVAALTSGRHAAPALAHRAAARGFIEDHLTDPTLGATWIASAIGISERQLSRVFAADGTSVPRHILIRRLLRAHWTLSVSAGGTGVADGGTPSIADVAAMCGFTSAAYFSHAFREHFGQRASDVRGAARVASA
jgi:AraC-like DNA-binding protein